MLARITDNNRIYIEQVSTNEELILDKEFSVRHPRAQYLDTSMGFFDGVYHKYNRKYRRLARPFLSDLVQVCSKRGLPLSVVDDRPPPKYPAPDPSLVTKDLLSGVELYDYQIGGIRSTCYNEVGVISAKTGAGKCVAYESKIFLNGNEIEIGKLFNGVNGGECFDVSDFGLSVLGPNGYANINRIYKTKLLKLRRVALSGLELRAADEHRVYTERGWRQLGDIAPGERVKVYSKNSTVAGNRWQYYPQEDSKKREEKGGPIQERCIYKVSLCELRGVYREGAEAIYFNGTKARKAIVPEMCEISERTRANGNQGIKSAEFIYNQKGECNLGLHEKSRDGSEGDGCLQVEIWGVRSGQSGWCRSIDGPSQRADNQSEERDVAVGGGGCGEIQKGDGRQKPGGSCGDQAEEATNLEGESRNGRIDKRIIFESSNNTNAESSDEVGDNNIPEQIRASVYKCLREIEQYIDAKEGAGDKISEFVVYFGFSGGDGQKQGDCRDKVEISIRDENGRDITEEVCGRKLCSTAFDDLSLNRVQEASRDGFYSDRYIWDTIISIVDGGEENCYDFQIDDVSHAYWANGVLSHNSEMAAGIAKIMNCPTIILCDMTIIVDQLKERLELRKTAEEVGMFYAGKRPNGQQIIVGSFQSLTIPSEPKKYKSDTPQSYTKKLKAYATRRKNARKLREIVGKCDLLLVDECDNATSKQWRNLFWYWFKGRRRYGFTGTPNDPGKPVQNLVLREHLGSVIHHVDRHEVEKVHRIVPVSYASIAFGDESMAKDRSAYDIALKEQIIENQSFHNLVRDVTALSLKDDPRYGTLILVESIPLGYTLESIIPDSKFICGNHPMPERMEAIHAFEDRKLRVLIGGKIIKRGLDLKGGCESLIIATGGKLSSDFSQKIGRAVRVNCRGIAKIYDFYFLGNYYLYSHSRMRIKSIVEMGYPAKVIFKNGVIEADKFIKSRFRRPKSK